ncbi:hypothetical protein CC2G_014248 [Coprinopsis cinerea AmutBmut pab1-1]|nr:hypothetical protein CC2G_014248 [Coprinopsis cinerea AmutBmut pab1-1]
MDTVESTSSPVTSPTRRFFWENVIFKVEDELFSVPQFRLCEESEVLSNMFSFSLEGRGTSSEGKDESIPIVLEGHKKDDFASLLKVLYPSFDDVTNNFKLVKNEWIGVLRLSTTWEMTRVRNHAIQSLSSLRLSFVEKVTLAREFRVGDWLKDGIVGLVMGDPVPLQGPRNSWTGYRNKNTLRQRLQCH